MKLFALIVAFVAGFATNNLTQRQQSAIFAPKPVATPSPTPQAAYRSRLWEPAHSQSGKLEML